MSGAPADPMLRLSWGMVAAILLVALLVRLGCWVQSPLIGADSARFLSAAKAFEQGRMLDGVRDAYHPLTGYLISLTHRVVIGVTKPGSLDPVAERDRRERCGYWVGLMSGLAVVWLLMELTRLGAPRVSPAAVGWLAASHVYLIRSSADVMSDSVFLMLLLLGLRQALLAASSGSWLTAVSAGGAAGMAYLARPEGLILLAVAPAFWLWVGSQEKLRVLRQSVAFWTAASLLVFPYALAISSLTGSFTLTLKKALVPLTGQACPWLASIPGAAVVEPLGEIFERWFSTCTIPLAPFALLGVAVAIRRRRSVPPGAMLSGLVVTAMLLVLWRLISVTGPGYLSRRHVFSMVALSLPWVVYGVEWLAERARGWRTPGERPTGIREEPLGRSRIATWILIALCLSGGVRALRPDRGEQLGQRHAGEYILEAEAQRPGAVVFSSREKVAYYALGRLESIAVQPLETLDRARRWPAAWIAFYPSDLYGDDFERFHRDWDRLPPGFRHEKTWGGEGSGRRLELYRWERPR